MTKIEAIQKYAEDACLEGIRRNYLILTQLKNKHDVCIIPEAQATAAESIVAAFGKKFSYYEGSKNGRLKCYFTPELTEEEMSEVEDCV